MGKKIFFISLMVFMVLAFAGVVWAFTPPASGSLAYDVYDIAVNKILQGPIGYVGGLGLVVVGIYSAIMGGGGIARSVLCIIAGGVLAGAPTVTSSLGFLM